MKRRLVAAASLLLLVLSIAGLGRALYFSEAWRSGVVASALLLVALAVLTGLLMRQRERLADVRQALARSEIRAQALIEASPDGVVLLSGPRIVFANPAFRRLLALPPDEELAGRDLLALVAPADRERVAAWLDRRQFGGQEADRIEFTGRRISGAEIPLEADSALLPARSGRQLALFVRDLSGRKVLESRLAHLARLEGLADVAERLVRDFDSLFLQIRRAARSAGKPGESRSEREILEAIERLASRGAALTRRVRALAPGSVDRSTHRPIDLLRLVRTAAADFLRASGPHLSLRVESETEGRLVINGDAAEVRQAIWQVLQNAQDARPDGEIRIRTRRLEVGEAEAAASPGRRPGRYAVAEITDSGPGMSPEERARALEPFFSTKGSRASGLGLTLAYGTVRAHGGFLELESEPGEGTTVRLAFPLVSEEETAALPREEEIDPRARWRGRETVLIVDDDAGSREEAMRLLESYGYHVELAGTPREALQRLRHRPRVDLVLLDMVLPGWNGPDVLRRILRHWPGQRVVMVSPYPLQEHEDHARQIGAVAIYRKPFRDPDLARAVREALDGPPPAPA